jgi:hypothetical protein
MMAGTIKGGKAAAKTNRKRHGDDFYARIGALGGGSHNKGGFNDRELAKRAGRQGGLKSKRGPIKKVDFNEPGFWGKLRSKHAGRS